MSWQSGLILFFALLSLASFGYVVVESLVRKRMQQPRLNRRTVAASLTPPPDPGMEETVSKAVIRTLPSPPAPLPTQLVVPIEIDEPMADKLLTALSLLDSKRPGDEWAVCRKRLNHAKAAAWVKQLRTESQEGNVKLSLAN